VTKGLVASVVLGCQDRQVIAGARQVSLVSSYSVYEIDDHSRFYTFANKILQLSKLNNDRNW